MIAKLVTHAPTRLQAIDAQARALDAFAIDGIRHNIPFVSALMHHPRWREGRLSTGFIAEEYPDGFNAPTPSGAVATTLAVVAAAIDHTLNERKRHISGQMRPKAAVSFERDRVVMLGRERHEFILETEDGDTIVRFGDGDPGLRVNTSWKPGQPVWQGSLGEEGNAPPIAVRVRPILNGFWLSHAGTAVEARVFTRREAALAALMPDEAAADTGKQLLCPMPGLVKAIAVSAGQEVKAGEPLAIVEAMKMENVLRAERDGTVARVLAKEGDSLAVDAVILEFA